MGRRGPKKQDRVADAGGVPSCPEMLDTVGAREWRRVIKDLTKLHGLGRLDRGVLTIYCQAWSDAHRLRRYLDEEGETYQSEKGMFHIRPEVEILNKAQSKLLQAAAALGMSPVSRSRLVTKSQKDTDSNDEFLDKRTRK